MILFSCVKKNVYIMFTEWHQHIMFSNGNRQYEIIIKSKIINLNISYSCYTRAIDVRKNIKTKISSSLVP